MAQIILDPQIVDESLISSEWTPDGPIPEMVRKFGYCIDLSDLTQGDLILVSSTVPNLVSKAVRKWQRKGGYPKEHAQWEHAAIYIMSGTICEATRPKVKISSLYDYIGTHKIRVRRNYSLNTDNKWGLVVNALKQMGRGYGFASVVSLLFKSESGFWKHKKHRVSYPKKVYYCSELYADAHVKSCGIALGNIDAGEITPASLSMESNLTDVPIKWVKIKPEEES